MLGVKTDGGGSSPIDAMESMPWPESVKKCSPLLKLLAGSVSTMVLPLAK